MKDEITGTATQQFSSQAADITGIVVLIQKFFRIHGIYRVIVVLRSRMFRSSVIIVVVVVRFSMIILVVGIQNVFVKHNGMFRVGFAAGACSFRVLTVKDIKL
jgi:hypothetical protein